MTAPKQKIELVYDDQCPVCRAYCKNIRFDDPSVDLVLIDARKGGALMNDISARGLDIDEGMIVKIGENLHCGSDAMRQIALRAQKNGWVAWTNRLFFSGSRARIFYPPAKAIRNFMLRLAGVKKIRDQTP